MGTGRPGAIFLAAGLGGRLRPLTLFEALFRTGLSYRLDRLTPAGIERVVVGVRHLAGKLLEALDIERRGRPGLEQLRSLGRERPSGAGGGGGQAVRGPADEPLSAPAGLASENAEDPDEPLSAPAGLASEASFDAPGEAPGEPSGEPPLGESSGEPSATGPRPFRAGFVAVIGALGVGKSSLVNRLLGGKAAAVSAGSRTTRHRILGVTTLPIGQAVLIDAPGAHLSTRPLDQAMVSCAESALADSDLCLWLVDAVSQGEERQTALKLVARRGGKPLVIAINKADQTCGDDLRPLAYELHGLANPARIVGVSAKTGRGVRFLQRTLIPLLPVSGPLFEDDAPTDQSLRALAAEIVRDTVFELFYQELYHAPEATIGAFKGPEPGDPEPLYRMEAAIHADLRTLKAMFDRRGGSTLKRIVVKAKLELEALLGGQVLLDLFVRPIRDGDPGPSGS
jgi:GTP-binding protein Era